MTRAGIYQVRHDAYASRRRIEEEASGESDEDLLRRIQNYIAWDKEDPDFFHNRSPARVRRRAYIREALRRGLIDKDPGGPVCRTSKRLGT